MALALAQYEDLFLLVRGLHFCYIYVKICLIIRDVINTCDDTSYNLSAYVCD